MDRGRLLLEYRPPAAHPMVFAGLLVFAVVWVTGSIENALGAQRRELYGLYGVPFALTLAWFLLARAGPVRIYDHGIAPGRPLVLAWWKPFRAWSELVAVYPCYYDVTGAFVSPFASSDGKVTQMGLALEDASGHVETVPFTPTLFTRGERESAGYTAAWQTVRDALARQDRPPVASAHHYTPDEQAAMLAEANKPFLPFFVILVLLVSAAPVVAILIKLGVDVAIALPLSLMAPIGVMLRSWVQSRRRHRVLNALAKMAEHQRGAA
jgi:hypothetical protein